MRRRTRYTELAKAGVISKAQHDQVRTSADVFRETVRAAEAGIESTRAALESDLAAVDRAKLDLNYAADHVTYFRSNRQPPGASRQSREGERCSAGRHQSGQSDLRQLQRSGAAPRASSGSVAAGIGFQ